MASKLLSASTPTGGRMGNYGREEVESAWAEFKRAGGHQRDPMGWCEQHPSLSRSTEWEMIDGDRVAAYIWNNLPDPTGQGRRFAFPNTLFRTYVGGGQFSVDGDYYHSANVRRVLDEWTAAGGGSSTPPDGSLTGIADWAPEPSSTPHPRAEIEAEFAKYRERGAIAVATGDWDQWSDQFTEDAHYREHHYGYFRSQGEIRGWITSVMKPFPTMEFPVSWYVIDDNRLSALIPNVLPPPPGDDGRYAFDVNTIMHYAGDGKWSYEEDLYSPADAEKVVKRWLAAGGVIPH